MKTIIPISVSILLTFTAAAQDEWNGVNNSTQNMHRDGNVAIGTGAPCSLPFVVEDIGGFEPHVSFGQQVLSGTWASSDAVLQITGQSTGATSNLSLYNGTGATAAYFDLRMSSAGASFYSGKGTSGTTRPIVFYTEDSNGMGERLKINANGKVGIGNPLSYPGNYNLYVTGGILTEKLKVAIASSANWSDYVFADDYNLRSIGELEAYINKNKHLPGMPSAEEVVKDGVDVAGMDARLLEKIEELSLYVIELKKEIEALKKDKGVK